MSGNAGQNENTRADNRAYAESSQLYLFMAKSKLR
jgi:hypothetical protein